MKTVDRITPRNHVDEELLGYLAKVTDLRRPYCPADFKYSCFEQFVIDHGSFFTPMQTLPDGFRPMTISQCFENAYRCATRTKAVHYVEGFAMGVIPIHHAWVVDRDGNAIDPTWANVGMGTSYIGVELDLTEVKKSRRSGSLALSDDYRHNFPILRGLDVIAKDAWHSHRS